MLKHYTKIQRSPVQFDIPDITTVGSPLIPLSDLGKHEEYDRVTVKAKVIKTNEPQTVATGKTKQDVYSHRRCYRQVYTCTLGIQCTKTCQSQVISTESEWYIVRVFMGKHHLTLPPTGSTVDKISDVENLHIDTDSSEEEDESVMGATVTGVYKH